MDFDNTYCRGGEIDVVVSNLEILSHECQKAGQLIDSNSPARGKVN